MNFRNCVALVFSIFFLVSCASDVTTTRKQEVVTNQKKANVQVAESSKKEYMEEGYASWYGKRFHGLKTASGPRYDMHEYTAAHRDLPLPSVVKVVNLENRKSVMVVVNDRGPYKGGDDRIIDMSKKAAKDLGFVNKGVARVKVEYLPKETKRLKSKLKPNQYAQAISRYKHLITKDATTIAKG